METWLETALSNYTVYSVYALHVVQSMTTWSGLHICFAVSFLENELLLVGSAWVSIGIEHYTVDSPNVEHFRAASFILCKKVVVFDRKVQNVGGSLSGSRAVSFVEMLSLFQSIHHQTFHCSKSVTGCRHCNLFFLRSLMLKSCIKT